MSDESSGCLLLIAVMFTGIAWANWHYDLNPLNDEITAYKQKYQCDKKSKKKCKWVNYRYDTYKVNPEMQLVITWSSEKPWNLLKPRDCIVVSKKHWSCGNLYKFGFNQGEYEVTGEDYENYRYVSKSRWWYNEL